MSEYTELEYRSQAPRDGEESRLVDLYIPDDAKDFPCLFFLHGGGLEGSSRKECAGMARRVASRGIAVIASEYRLYPKAKFPDFLIDAATALRWTWDHIGQYGGMRENIFVGGHSAGAYLAAMLTLDKRYLSEVELSPDIIRGTIPISGQMTTHFAVLRQRGISEDTKIIDANAPLYYATGSTIPFLNMCAEDDFPARPEENGYFIACMRDNGNENCRYLTATDRDHGSILHRMEEENDPGCETMIQFIRSFCAG